MAVAELTLFGGFGVRAPSEAAIDLLGQKERALLAFLALTPRTTHSRDKLASLLWSDRGDPQARDSLKHALTNLRQCLQSADSPAIIADRQSVRLDPAAVSTDVAAFERLLSGGTPDSIEQAMAAGERDRAEAAARRLLTLDPLREAAGRALMQLHAERGEAAQALRLYETLRERLQQELGAKPEPETTRLYDAIREHRAPPTAPPPERSTVAPPPLPDKPSVAVLPFENLSGDPEQQYFSDGITEDI